MSDIKTVTLDGTELKVEGMGGQNTIIVNRGSATLYASVSANVTPDGDNTAAIPSGGVMNLYGTNGTVYLLGTGKVELEGTDYSDTGRAAAVSSGGGSSGGGVSKEYVDGADTITLNSAKKYTDGKTAEIEAKIPVIPEALPANGGNAETAERLSNPRTINGVEFDGSKDIEIDAVTQAELADLKAYIGYTDSDIYGLEADFENNRFTRLAGAVGKTAGADFDSVNAFGGRRRCTMGSIGNVLAYYGDSTYDEDGRTTIDGNASASQCMVEQPKFYYKVVPLKTEKIDGADGYHLRKARYYISDTPKAGFKVHPAFVQNGVEVDKIYLSAFEGCIYDTSANAYLLEDEQIADFDGDLLSSVANAKPASGTTQALTRANARKLARNRGAGWGITTIQTLSATQLLFAVEYATFNSQTAIGNGIIKDSYTQYQTTGGTSSLGNSSGVGLNDSVSYRGEENLWGNIYYHIDYDMPLIISNSGYISAFLYTEKDDGLFISSETMGNNVFPIGDMMFNAYRDWTEIVGNGTNIYTDTGSTTGIFIKAKVGFDTFNKAIGARLIYIPQPAQEVTSE